MLAHLKTLSEAERPARFIYHNKYSTSSYFLPSLLFRARRVFGLGDRASNPAGVTTIAVERNASPSSSDLIRAVADSGRGRETIASVWNGPMSGFADPAGKHYQEFGKKVRFVPLPDDLPCDLLVATRKVDDKTKDAITAKLETLQPIGPDAPGSDVHTWVQWANVEAEGARRALSELRRQAGSSTLPVVVDVQPNQSSPVDGDLLDAARLAIRRAGTELVDRSQYFDYYKKSDIRWELERIHDGAVRLTVRYENFRLDNAEVTQQFDVSFQAPSDLTRRLVSLIHSRLHRIRPVWLYNDTAPTVLRDVDFDIAKRVPFQEIQWNEPQRNDYRLEGESRVANVEKEETFEIQLATAEFPETCRQPEPGLRTDGTAGVPRAAHARDARADAVPGAHHRVRRACWSPAPPPWCGMRGAGGRVSSRAPGATADASAPSPVSVPSHAAAGEAVLSRPVGSSEEHGISHGRHLPQLLATWICRGRGSSSRRSSSADGVSSGTASCCPGRASAAPSSTSSSRRTA